MIVKMGPNLWLVAKEPIVSKTNFSDKRSALRDFTILRVGVCSCMQSETRINVKSRVGESIRVVRVRRTHCMNSIECPQVGCMHLIQ
jgi:hypothetical protein